MKSSRIPGAEIRWREYRKAVTNYIAEEIQTGETVAIIGAGACDDIEIGTLLAQGAEIWLADIDTEAMKSVMLRMSDQNHVWAERLHWIETDLMQLSDSERRDYEDACIGCAALETWWNRRDQQWEQGLNIYKDIYKVMREQAIRQFDHVICLGVNSQLCIPLVLPLEREMKMDDREWYQQAVQRIRQENERLARAFLAETGKIARQMVLGLEYTTIYRTQAYREQQICQALEENGSIGLHALKLPRVEGAYQVEEELGIQCRRGDVQIKDHQYMLWPFSEEKTYLMVIFKLLTI